MRHPNVSSLKHPAMAKTAPPPILLLLPLSILCTLSRSEAVRKESRMYPLTCSSTPIKNCTSYSYHIDTGLSVADIAGFYSVDPSAVKPIIHKGREDHLVSVPCTCDDVNGSLSYVHNTLYKVRTGDTVIDIANGIYSGQALMKTNKTIYAGDVIPVHLLCGCLGESSEVVVTYTVQQNDTLSSIASLLASSLSEIQSLNGNLTEDPSYIDVGGVLFVPSVNVAAITEPKQNSKKKSRTWIIAVPILVSGGLLVAAAGLMYLYRRRKMREMNLQDPKRKMSKVLSGKSIASLQIQHLQRENVENARGLDTERPVVFGLDEIAEGTANFDESRKIGEGGYGSVYYGVLGEQEVAIKKMKSSKSKEFFAELRVLCKVHHINVVELMGYSTGDDHLYLIYEYVRNGSLTDHLHDPLLKGRLPLSWTARAQIALDAARGIEYIHDHTKARYVHRDIKTSNILLDQSLRAKVADFGLAKLVERSAEEDFIATRLVGTPGYLPPESVLELQTTPKTDVFAFGVVLAELITGHRALVRDNREPNKMKSLISIMSAVFQEEETEGALEAIMDGNLRASYPMDEVHKMAELAVCCLSDDPVERPDMQEVVVKLSHILMSSIEWEASLGGNSQIFTGVFNGR